MNRTTAFLYSGLAMLLFAFLCKWAGMPGYCFWGLFVMAIALKTLFLVFAFRKNGFKPKPWFYFILAGVALILLSMLFKTAIPIPVVYKILFYGAITLKVAGLLLMLFSRRK